MKRNAERFSQTATQDQTRTPGDFTLALMFVILRPCERAPPTSRPETVHIFFLAGPVQGGGQWQVQMTAELKQRWEAEGKTRGQTWWIAVPWAWETKREGRRHRRTEKHGAGLRDFFQDESQHNPTDSKLAWERRWLLRASQAGCLVFWLAKEDSRHPRRDGTPYASSTRGELGEWRGRLMADVRQRLGLVLGGDSSFPGLRTIRDNFGLALPDRCSAHQIHPSNATRSRTSQTSRTAQPQGHQVGHRPQFPFYTNMPDVVAAAVRCAHRVRSSGQTRQSERSSTACRVSRASGR